MLTIQVHLRQIQVLFNALTTPLPDRREAAICAPFAPMVIHGLPTRFIALLALLGCFGHWQTIPLTASVQVIQNQVENSHQRRFAHIDSFCLTQVRQDILLELFLGYTFWDSAHDWLLLQGVLA